MKRTNFINKKISELSGITLIALVITIIVLLILAGITIATLTGDNGLIEKANASKSIYQSQTRREKGVLNELNDIMEEYDPNSLSKILEFGYSGKCEEVTLPSGTYMIECWGAQGGGTIGGKGAYTRGVLSLDKDETLFLYVGSTTSDSTGGYNGGGSKALYGGGGATDVRLVGGDWNDSKSLASRIMVAAGGGGADLFGHQGGHGGALVGSNGSGTDIGYGGTQISGGVKNSSCIDKNTVPNGSFGYGGSGSWVGESLGQGGGGYYGGSSAGGAGDNGSGGGGSSYISGYEGCIAIVSEENTSPKVNSYPDISDSYHYSGYIFNDATIIAGDNYMPNFESDENVIGNTGNGHIRISKVINNNPPIITDISTEGNSITINAKNISKYYYSTENIKPNSLSEWIPIIPTKDKNYTITNLEFDTTYFFWVMNNTGMISEESISIKTPAIDDVSSIVIFNRNYERVLSKYYKYLVEIQQKEGEGLKLSSDYGSNGYITYNQKIDLSSFKKITIKGKRLSGNSYLTIYMGTCNKLDKGIGGGFIKSSSASPNAGEEFSIELDIEDISDAEYVALEYSYGVLEIDSWIITK